MVTGSATWLGRCNICVRYIISIPYHQVTWFTEDNLIAGISGLYDRTELVASYDEDPIKIHLLIF